MFKNPLLWAIIIFICAAVFRLTSLDLIEFKLDEARDVYEMEKFWQNPTLLERGTIQSTGVYNPPLWYYLLVVISAPSRDPQYLSFMIALINCVAVAGFYLVIRRFFGQAIALTSSLLLAFSPWNILFSRKIWAPDMILSLLVPWLYFLFSIVIPAKVLRSRGPQDRGAGIQVKWAWFGLALCLSLLAQLHASGIFLAVVSIIIITINAVSRQARLIKIIKIIEIPIDWKFALLGLALSLIPLLPYINYQIRTGCEDCRNYSTYQEGEAVVTPFFDGNAFLRPFQFVNGSGWDNTLGDEGFRDFKEKYPLVGVFLFFFLLEFLLLPIGVFSIIKLSNLRILSLLSYLILIPILYFLSKTPSHLYYFLIVSPISILIYTLGAFAFSRPKWVSIAIITFIISINIIFELLFVNFLSETKVIPGDYGPTFGVVKEMAGEAGMKVEEYVIVSFGL